MTYCSDIDEGELRKHLGSVSWRGGFWGKRNGQLWGVEEADGRWVGCGEP